MNSYAIVGDARNLIVDSGMAHPACCETVERAMQNLNLDLEYTDFFITHHHLDHFSSVSRFLRRTSRIYISEREAEFIQQIASGEAEAETAVFLERMGFPEKNPMDVVSQFFNSEYGRRHSWPFR